LLTLAVQQFQFLTVMTRIYLLLTIAFIGSVFASRAQNTITTDTINSKILNEQRIIQVFLPSEFDPKEKYDVLYVLDGDDFGVNANQILSMTKDFEYTPSVILVSIWNRQIDRNYTSSRNRDFLPVAAEGYTYAGGADKFLSFFRSELIPFIDHKYPSSHKNLLFGHSYGGLFTLYTLFTQPDLFQSYIASDPSLWWNDGYVDKLALKNINKISNLGRTLYFGARTGALFHVLGSYSMDSILKARVPPGLVWKSTVYDNERHQSVKIKTLYDGLKFTYFGYNPTPSSLYMSAGIGFYPSDGILLKDKPIKLMSGTTFLNYEPGIRYTIDGTEPTKASPKFEFGTAVSAPADVTLKLFSTRSPNLTAKGHFSLGQPLAATPPPLTALPGGFNYSYYKGQWKNIPDLDKLKPQKEGLAKNFIKEFISDTTGFACRIDGFIKVEKAGYYTFFLQADEQARLYLGNKLLVTIHVENDSLDNRSFVIPLDQGFYPVKIEYLHIVGDPNLRFTYMPPAIDDIFVPALFYPDRLRFHKPSN
jgi:predicted alpha/beta superfamily hydrolase